MPGPGAAPEPDAGEAVTPEPGDPAHTAEGVRAHGLAGDVGVLPRVAAQDAVDARKCSKMQVLSANNIRLHSPNLP